MVKEILLRSYTNEGYDKIQELMCVILTCSDMDVTVVDHSNVTLNDFEILPHETPVSIDKFLAEKLNIPYFRISRVFNQHGSPMYRHVDGNIIGSGPNIRILDTDKVFGTSIKLACRIFNTKNYSTLLTLNENQDLIDVEDLMFKQSLLQHDGETTNCSYLLNERFFKTRTSLSSLCYKNFCRILNYDNQRIN